ncbi:MAG: hypothetical protein ACO1QB_17780 [Verrucomicrobiales bacterium]
MKLNIVSTTIAALLLALNLQAADKPATPAVYKNDFEKAEVNSVPEEMLVLDGGFAVKESNGNKVLELPGAPLESFGVLFGPNGKENMFASARILGSGKGRRFPTFGIGLNGVSGFKLRVAPAKKALELYRGDNVRTSIPYNWESGKWSFLKLETRAVKEGVWKVTGKVWQEGSEEPAKPQIVWEEKQAPSNGRAMITASPFSGTPILFDDLAAGPVSSK